MYTLIRYATKTYGLRWIKIAYQLSEACALWSHALWAHENWSPECNAIRNLMKYHYLQCAMARPTLNEDSYGAQPEKPWDHQASDGKPHWTCHAPQHPKSIAAAARRHSGPAPGAHLPQNIPMTHGLSFDFHGDIKVPDFICKGWSTNEKSKNPKISLRRWHVPMKHWPVTSPYKWTCDIWHMVSRFLFKTYDMINTPT